MFWSKYNPFCFHTVLLGQKWVQYNIVLAFWETKSTYFCFKMLYSTHFCLKRIVWTQKGLYQNTVLKCFDTEILYYGSKGFCWLGLYHSFTYYSKVFPHIFLLQNLSFGFKRFPSACLRTKMKFWFGFAV